MRIDLNPVLKKEKKTFTTEADLEMNEFSSKLGTFPIVSKTPVLLSLTNEGGAQAEHQWQGDIGDCDTMQPLPGGCDGGV